MGILYDLIKKEVEQLKEYSTLEQTNFLETKTWPKVYGSFKNAAKVNSLMSIINKNAEELFGSKEEFRAFLREHEQELLTDNPYDIPTIDRLDHYYRSIPNYEKFLNNLEKKLGDDNVEMIADTFDYNLKTKPELVTRPLVLYTDQIKSDLANLGLSEEDIKGFSEDLDYVGNNLICKRSAGETEFLIDDVSVGRDYEARKNLKQFARDNHLDPDQFDALNGEEHRLEILPTSDEVVNMTKPFGLNGLQYSDETYEKIAALDQKIRELGVPSTFFAGEQGLKSYGLTDYFAKGQEITRLIGTYDQKITNEEKINHLRELSIKKKELVEIEKKYDELFDFIKQNFDLDKIGLSGNIYCGRKYDFIPQYKGDFVPNLPEKWDMENAGIVTVLNGFCQLKGAANEAGKSLKEYIDNPVKSYLKGAHEYAKTFDDKFYLRRSEDNPLGKRIAQAFVNYENAYTGKFEAYGLKARGFEFLNNAETDKDLIIQNAISANIGTNYIKLYNHSAEKMFMKNNEPDYESIKNLFACGDKTDRLCELSNNYYDADLNKGAKMDYNTAVRENASNSPINELNRVMKTLKDYCAHRDSMISNPGFYPGEQLEEKVDKAAIFMGAKKYFDDFVIKNNIDILRLNDKDRRLIQNFMKDPVTTTLSKYKRELEYDNEDIGIYKDRYKALNDNENRLKAVNFAAAFDANNNAPNGYNVGKNISQIIKDNNGGWLEWIKRSTSKEYKALREAVKAATDRNSPTYGEHGAMKMYAQKYLAYKLPEGADESRLNSTEKRRVEFCRSVLDACRDMERENQALDNEQSIISNNIIIDNKEFQKQLNNDSSNEIFTNNNNIDQQNENNNIISNDMDL